MFTKITKRLREMNKIAYKILYFGIIAACLILISGAIIKNADAELYYRMSDDFGTTGVAVFAESVIGALFIDCYSKSKKE